MLFDRTEALLKITQNKRQHPKSHLNEPEAHLCPCRADCTYRNEAMQMHRGVKQTRATTKDKPTEKDPSTVAAFRKAFFFSLSNPGNFRAKEQHAHVYSCGRRTKPPAIPSAHFIGDRKKLVNMKHKTDSRFNHRGHTA